LTIKRQTRAVHKTEAEMTLLPIRKGRFSRPTP
jgi:hypothetical protein